MKKFSMAKYVAAAALFGLAFFTACGDDSSSANSEKSESDAALEELKTAHRWLGLRYIYGTLRNEFNEDVNVYVGKGTEADSKNKFDQPSCTEAYYDVCYMFNQMSDPYTRYFDPTYAPEQIEKAFSPEAETMFLGAEVALYDEEKLLIEVTEAKADAKEDELQVGDIFYAKDVSAYTLNLTPGDTVDLTFNVTRGKGDDAVKVEVHARAVKEKRPTVRLHYENTESGDSIPVIRITEFDVITEGDGGTYEEFARALEQTSGSKSLILDLRDNGGGDTEHCSKASAEFLSKGDTVVIDLDAQVYINTMNDSLFQKIDTTVYVAEKDGVAKDRYVVMLANNYSASCAEIMLSAIASNRKFPIVGKLTYGKQIGQYLIFDYGDNDPDLDYIKGFAYITGLVGYDKDWKLYHDVGIVPDYDISDRQEQMKKAVELAVEATEMRTAGYGTEKLGHFAKASKLPGMPFGDVKLRYKRVNGVMPRNMNKR